ncbi:TrkH family potassium uptake protein [Sulfurovum sp. ST-21]|uniref:TrkH family potassium uptake protein n=1 Tax=Sulfurovum indicum TaxID=2779528 RepID=A0A7M1S2U9_9BACT|nr:TrkH family potassium uptake protein [Sulfurovum indicum]QOR61666.1 TrkH family potassium uptake protein [Sulfurovum indicum]
MDLHTLKNIFKFVSVIGITLSFFLISAIVVGWYYQENMRAFIYFDILLFSVNTVIFMLLKNHTMKLSIKGGILSVNFTWILLGVAGAVPLMLYTDISFPDAFFESISGFTTTGATIFSDIESLPKSILYLRSLMHWLGGMGIIVLGVGLFSLINPSGSMALFKAESTGIKMEKVTPKIKDTAIRLWGIYILFTLIDAFALKLAGMNFFDAVNHAFSTISTGGFSTKNDSLGYYDSNVIIWITTFFMIISGINFLVHLKLFSSGKIDGYKREEVLWYVSIFIVLSLILGSVDIFIDYDSTFHALTHSFFTIASILTTTGFATLDYAQWGHIAISVIFVAMLIGGNAGSTAGGVKVIRYIVLFKNLSLQLKRTLQPNAVVNVFIDKQKVSSQIISSTTGFIFLFIITNMLITLYLFARGFDAMTSVSTALATVGNIGPGFALTGPACNYAFFSDMDKIILSMAMIMGRLEFYTVFLLFSRIFWKKF